MRSRGINNKTAGVAYLGPEGTYSHMVAARRFGQDALLVPQPSIIDACAFAAEDPSRHCVVPVENSSGGPITETVDLLISNRFNLAIEECLYLNVKLALLGRKGQEIKKVYSHAVPLIHCDTWLRREMPSVKKTVVSSTSEAARLAASEKDAVAIASLGSAAIYKLDALIYPIEQDVPNITQFYSLRLEPARLAGKNRKTTIAAELLNDPGSLYDFLEPFKLDKINLSRIISRPVYGKPHEYAFYVDVDGDMVEPRMRSAIAKVSKACATLRVVSSYPVRKPYDL